MGASRPVSPLAPGPTTIKIAEDAHPNQLRRSESEKRFPPLQRTDTTGLAGGVYNTRNLSRVATHRSSIAQRISFVGDTQQHSEDVEEGDNWRDSEQPKVKQVYRGKTLLWLAYQSVGAIYGDIGTSPLYVFSSTFTAPPDRTEVLQVLSLIIWSLTIMVTFKYVFIVLRADNEGEGGTFSCYSLLTRFVSVTFRLWLVCRYLLLY
jgi:KUP system potassium uptake protein